MTTTTGPDSRSAVARVLARRDSHPTGRPAPVSVLLGCVLLLLWGYLTYVDWPVAWPAPFRPIVKAIGWIWIATD